ncbi:MAG: hypothetical protein JW990_08495, partial [Thermoleophilia bacterium]|nr:hypothetical protein [Thermoleophilia bacterium]
VGGELTIEVEPGEGAEASPTAPALSGGYRVFMTGPAEKVFECELSNEFLRRLGWPGGAAD